MLQELFKIIILNFLPALLLTIAIECGLMYLLFSKREYCYYVLLLNILTNPLLNFIMLMYYNYMGMTHYYTVLYVLEVAVVVTEGLILAKLWQKSYKKSILISLFLNGTSYLIGVLIF